MDANQQAGQQHQTQEKFKCVTHFIKEWPPICVEELKPKEGLEFDNLDECERFYKTYALHVGFIVRKSSCKKDQEDVEKFKYFICSNHGFKRTSVKVNSNRNVNLTREGCNAMIAKKPIFSMDDTVLEGCSQIQHENNSWIAWKQLEKPREAHFCLEGKKLTLTLKGIREISKELQESSRTTSESRASKLGSFLGSSAPKKIEILPPKQSSTKQSGTAIEEQEKRKRLCKACGEQVYHDSRNYPNKLRS
ncbi:hypothetical protein Cgig2_024261 [Carnegiea gigantea]|uniref:FAR1 domain-containing protein n=1 Tax=Carnegiea gigantea TaxID=171969 RepID=A0A9Q1GGX5_9CARY|nr:hypothetical protein Cgig2_024261 [Carnegiea gigantea]